MIQFLLVVLILASNVLGVSRTLAEASAVSGRDVIPLPIRGRARWLAPTLAVVLLLPAVANAQNAYITDNGTGTVSVIDTATNTVVATIPSVGCCGVAVTADGSKVYASAGSSGVKVIDTATNTVVATIPLGTAPYGARFLAVTPDGSKVYVGNLDDNTVLVIDTATNTVVATIPGFDQPEGIAVTPDGSKVYVANFGNMVSVIDAVTNTVVATISLGTPTFSADFLAVTPDGAKVYVTNGTDNTVSVIDTATNTVVATIPVISAQGVAVTPDGSRVYVTDPQFDVVLVIDTATNTVTAGIAVDVGRGTNGVAVTPDGAKAYVPSGNTVSVIDTATNTVVATIPGFTAAVTFGKFIGPPPRKSLPVAVNETATTTANTPVTIDLTAGASGNPTSAALVGTPVGGMVAGFPGTTVTFTPTAGFSGTASFQFTLANAVGTSNTAMATITVTGPPAPTISSVSPNPVTGSNNPQPFTINGSSFVSGANVTLRDLTAGQIFPNRVPTSFSSTQIVINPVFTTAADNWSVEVINPDGQSSGQFLFQVIAPPILSVNPASLPVNAIAGTASISVSNIGGGTMTYSASITSGASWLSITSGQTGANSGTIIVSYSANIGSQRVGTIQVSTNGASGSPVTVTITQATGVVVTPTISVHLVDPFLLKNVDNQFDEKNIKLTQLYRAQKWDIVQAKGLLADDVSAAIAVVKTTDCTDALTLTTTKGTTLLPWSGDYLTTPPQTGGSQSLSIPVTDLSKNIGGSCFAATLVQTPVGSPAPSFDPPVRVTAQQGGFVGSPAEMALVPPPVVLVHGIWDDQTGLAGIASYLRTSSPWNIYPDLVELLCYSKYLGFHAPIDPLSKDSIEPCEQTSEDALASTVHELLTILDSKHIVGSRVDAVAHSMGGLAARWWASQDSYKVGAYSYLRNRHLGEFHRVITLDTPEFGSQLAPFLNTHSSCKFHPKSILTDIGCVPALSLTVRTCLAAAPGMPLAYPGWDINLGAVYSLFPDGPALQNLKLSPPNIKGTDWYAISAIAPNSSKLKYFLNKLIEAIIPPHTATATCAPLTARTIDDILEDPKHDNDAIVTRYSQLWGFNVQADHQHRFPDLSHTALPILLKLVKPGLSDANVVNSPDVNRQILCWLAPSACPSSSLATSITPVSASKISLVNKNAVPKEVAPNTTLPCERVKEFHAHRAPITGIRLDLANPSVRLQPWVVNADFTGQIYLDMRSVSYSIAPSDGQPVVSLEPNGILRGLREGTATIIGQCGLRSDKVLVAVGAEQN